MQFKTIKVTPSRTINRGGKIRAVNVTAGKCASTITTRYGAIGFGNIITRAHYPMTVVLYEL